jgi:tetratricopeptide (TPR) repeat protein
MSSDGARHEERGYTTKDVARMLGLDPALVRAFARAGIEEVSKGPRGEMRFGFRDLVLLRAARNLVTASIPPVRVREILRKLRSRMPPGEPASGARLAAEGGRVVARLGGRTWDAESGQARFEFGGAEAPPLRRIAPGEEEAGAPVFEADEWLELGVRLEPFAPEEARESFRRCLELRPRHPEAHARLGRMLQSQGEFAAAAEHHALAVEAEPSDADHHHDLGLALEGLGRLADAMKAWRDCVRLEPGHADAYLHLAVAADRAGDKRAALEYLAAYHRLT